MKLRFERVFSALPEVVWPYLTVPDQMNAWSEAKVQALTPGANGAHDSVGATRRVTVPAFGLTSTLDEEVTVAIAPERFEYRVVRGGGLRNHRGTQTLTLESGKTTLVWEVTFEAALPGLVNVLGAILRPRLARSLDLLVTIIAARNH